MQSYITHTHRYIKWHKEAQLALLIFLLLLFNGITGIPAMAEEPAPAHHVKGASATNPVAPITQLQLQNQFIPDSYDSSGYSNVFIVQPVLPYEFFGSPMISRFTLPLISTPDPDGPIDKTTDFGDLTTINFAMFDIKDSFWGGDFGIGPALVLPTGADDRTGSGKWQGGPTAIYINTANPKMEWGLLLYHVWSFAGDGERESVSQTSGQPVFTYFLDDGWYLSTGDHIMTYDYKSQKWDLPLPFGVGKNFKIGKQANSAYLIPYYNVGDDVSDKWGIKLSWSLLF